ncbi:hypothetical protein NA57DRAFT_59951 [Rhizodiscina lignyota]|uniref:Uncharacterized protein n=1 Tax=Rhizodiscina lignyota TaxID=1504668 RepID=A0A9P4I4X6_9PEZI|nr:hypothetical protein NA57DRAFT_59951 [Rhizodiscina lignyota]
MAPNQSIEWTAEADRKLFYAILVHKGLKFGKDDHEAIAKMMSEGELQVEPSPDRVLLDGRLSHSRFRPRASDAPCCSPGAVRNRLSALQTKLKKEGVDNVAGAVTKKGGIALSAKSPNSKRKADTPKDEDDFSSSIKGKKLKYDDSDDDDMDGSDDKDVLV